eukprot:GHVT01091151.1.p1 GENE.GHVT01091151.1~~GHVT01091151.1.p1  ORF type:complete len:311 (+),score=66.51 GHVT01091151.1:80-934(+)
MLPPPPPPLSSSSAVGGRRLLPLDLEGVEESTLVEVEALWRTFCWMGGLLPAQANAVPPTAAAPPTIVLPASPAAKARLKLKKAPGDRGPDDSQGAAEKTTPHAQLDPALSATGMQRDASAKRPLGVNDLFEVFNRLEHKATKAEVEDMIWEADDNLDGRVSWDEILILYRRCINDKTGFEPRQLFTLVQFLMYDSDFTGRITVEQTLQILFVRCGRELLDQVSQLNQRAQSRHCRCEPKSPTTQNLQPRMNIAYSKYPVSILRWLGNRPLWRILGQPHILEAQ